MFVPCGHPYECTTFCPYDYRRKVFFFGGDYNDVYENIAFYYDGPLHAFYMLSDYLRSEEKFYYGPILRDLTESSQDFLERVKKEAIERFNVVYYDTANNVRFYSSSENELFGNSLVPCLEGIQFVTDKQFIRDSSVL
jgi:hypothetical protein